MFSTASGLMVLINDLFMFADFRKKDGASTISPIALTVVIITSNNDDKEVMNPKKGAWKKGVEPLPA